MLPMSRAESPSQDQPGFPPLVSVGVPVHNGEQFLAEAVRSVLDQNYANLELIICDNASADATEAICRTIASGDNRVRYLRNPTNIGLLGNFRRTLDEARGKYFTWLAHDDLMTDPAYLTTLVGYLEKNPGTVICTSDFRVLNSQYGVGGDVVTFPELAAGTGPESRRLFFRWPTGWDGLVVYGLVRTAALRKIQFPEPTFKGHPHLFWWETDVLTSLCRQGSIVALSGISRSYRLAVRTAGTGLSTSFSTFDLYRIGLRMKLVLIGRAVGMPGPLSSRLRLAGTAVANLFRANLGQPYDHTYVTRSWAIAVGALESAARERAEIVESLVSVVQERREAAAAIGVDAGPVVPEVEAAMRDSLPDPPELPGHRPDRLTSAFAGFFRPPSADQVRRRNELQARMGELNLLCARLLSTIETLNAEALRLQGLLDSAAGSGRRAPD
jgi:glycosyltransferase involved in cell wall biosynthesis